MNDNPFGVFEELEKFGRLLEIEAVAKDLCRSQHETEQNYHRARLGHLVDDWPEAPASYDEYVAGRTS